MTDYLVNCIFKVQIGKLFFSKNAYLTIIFDMPLIVLTWAGPAPTSSLFSSLSQLSQLDDLVILNKIINTSTV